MKMIRIITVGLLLTMLCSCAKYIAGPYYVRNKKYDECIVEMSGMLNEDPQDDAAAYYLGRCYLANDKPEKALPYFRKAVELDPDNADYRFWLGVNHWALADFENERKAYADALEIDSDHISANLYMGHSYFDRGKWEKALTHYELVVKKDPYNPEALFNRLECKWQLGKRKELLKEWKKYLEYYPDGVRGLRATMRLNSLGDFTYRNYLIGQRMLTLRTPEFKDGKADMEYESMASMEVLAAIMEEKKDLVLNIVAFVKGDLELARQRSIEVRDLILAGHPDISSDRLLLSWFGEPEKVDTPEGKKTVDETVLFITEVSESPS